MRIHCFIEEADKPYIGALRTLVLGHTVTVSTVVPESYTQLQVFCIEHGIEGVIATHPDVLKLVALVKHTGEATIQDYAGSLFTFKRGAGKTDILIVNGLKQVKTMRTGLFVLSRYVAKLTKPKRWFKQTAFTWEVATLETLPALYEAFADALFIACDIETPPTDPEAGMFGMFPYCVGYCAIWFNEETMSWKTHTIVIPTLTLAEWSWVKKFNKLTTPKIFQNGIYDNTYFIRFGAPVCNYMYDTQYLMHAWYSELPKRLSFVGAFILRDIRFWKDDHKTGVLQDKYEYNARDCWTTANAFLAMVREMDPYAFRNYVETFRVVPACIFMGMVGVAVDPEVQKTLQAEQSIIKDAELKALGIMTATQGFNPGSPKQKKELLTILGAKNVTTSDEKALIKACDLHPVANRILQAVMRYQKSAKLLSTYINIKLFNGRWYYSFGPASTDTARFASKASSYWCGTQIQNAPPYAKKMVCADIGYLFGEADYAQSEARCVGYLAEDTKLIGVVESDQDYHGLNAAAFFGIPYEQIVETTITMSNVYTEAGEFVRAVKEVVHKTLDKAIRDLSKRTNHGANYNMGARVMLHTMGDKNVYRAKLLLKLPSKWTLIQVCEYLLAQYAKTYPKIKNDYYNLIIATIVSTKCLVSPLGWTRRFFGDPTASKRNLNAAVAHPSQNLSVGIINRCLVRGMRWQVHPANVDPKTGKLIFILLAQIHDSIFFQYLMEYHDQIPALMQKMMHYPVNVHGRTMVIPVDVKCGKPYWSDLK